jgi:hypothetical protein
MGTQKNNQLQKNYFSNTVPKILHNVARRIKFQIHIQAEGDGEGQNYRENSVIMCMLTAQIQKCNLDTEIYFPNIWI